MEVGESIFEKWTRSCSVTELSLVEILARVVNRRANMVVGQVKRRKRMWISATLPGPRRPEVDPGVLPVSLGFGNSGSDNGDRRGGDSGVIITATGT